MAAPSRAARPSLDIPVPVPVPKPIPVPSPVSQPPSRSRTPLSARLQSLVSSSPSSSSDQLQTNNNVQPDPDSTPDAATLQDRMKRLLSPSGLRAVPPPPTPSATLTADLTRSLSSAREPVVLRASPSTPADLSEALSDDMFPPLPKPSPQPTTPHKPSHRPKPRRLSSSPTSPTTSTPPRPLPAAHLSPHSPSFPPSPPPLPPSLSITPLPAAHLSRRRSSSLLARLSSSSSPPNPNPAAAMGLHTTPAQAGWWWRREPQKVDGMLNEEDKGRTQEESEEIIQQKYKTPKYPLVFCHGLLGFDQLSIPVLPASLAPGLTVTHWRGITDVLKTNGVQCLITRVPATSGIEERARVLKDKVESEMRGRKVHLIGHSMGGLDCRYLVSQLDPDFEVVSVTTIATPHRGSAFANYFIDELIGKERLPSVISLLDTILPNANGDGSAFSELTREHMARFNERTPDREGVRYFSWGATYEPGLVDSFRWPHGVILAQEGPNDGLVSVESAKWGTYLGTLEHVNHLDLIGWMNVARYRWAEFLGNKIKYKPATFYLGVASHLAKVEEEMEQAGEGATATGPDSAGVD